MQHTCARYCLVCCNQLTNLSRQQPAKQWCVPLLSWSRLHSGCHISCAAHTTYCPGGQQGACHLHHHYCDLTCMFAAMLVLSQFILKCAMARLPSNPYLMTLHANLLVEMKRDGSSARTQLQLAAKASPSLLDRYFIYSGLQFLKTLKSESKSLHWLKDRQWQ